LQIIFQDPYASLNPRMTVGAMLGEPLFLHRLVGNKARRRERVGELLELVGLRPDHARRYPHEFSGGQRQRLAIARALAVEPRLIVADEPVSALDVSIQAQVINLMRSLQQRFGLSYIFISHDLAVVKHIADRIAVMYLGKIVETATTDELFRRPRHPYTRALLSAVPLPDPTAVRERALLEGDIPSAMNPPPGCPFHTRCRFARESCRIDVPVLADDGSGHATACPWWPEFPPPPAILETAGQDQDRQRLDRLQAAFVSQTEAT
jgi:peptide/nickel transport system ATP-binding protein/oligopeptide transport system ATP-binding protein